jgi:hypothetical protein
MIRRQASPTTQKSIRQTVLLLCGILSLVIILVAAYMLRVKIKEKYLAWTAPSLPVEEPYRPTSTLPSPTTSTRPTPSTTTTNDGLPKEKRLSVPFMSQAPHANWDEVHEETCEEASVIMAAAYYHGESGRIDPDEAERRLQEILAFEMDEYKFNLDTSATETKRFLEGMYPDLEVELIPDPTANDIKQAIADGHPVIVPADGKALPNPNFRNGGPKYHMLVVRGYTQDHFITTDPGTRLGENFLYTYDGLLSSIHDWNGGDVPNGDRKILVVKKK